MGELISIIVPVYNVEKYIDRCINSILSQTYANVEIILIDDGSTDSSGDICDHYATIDSRVYVLRKSNGGLSEARNCGIEISTGKYIVFVDSDDVVAPNYIECMYEMVVSSCAQIGICDFIHVYDESDIEFRDEKKRTLLKREEALRCLLYQKLFLVSACGKIYDSVVFRGIRFPIGKVFEDNAIMHRVFEKAETIVYSDAALYGYCHRVNSITNSEFGEKDFEILNIGKEIYDYYLKNNPQILRAAKSFYVVSALRVLMNCPNYSVYSARISEANDTVRKYGPGVVVDFRARNKTRVGVLLYLISKKLARFIHKKVDRWK